MIIQFGVYPEFPYLVALIPRSKVKVVPLVPAAIEYK